MDPKKKHYRNKMKTFQPLSPLLLSCSYPGYSCSSALPAPTHLLPHTCTLSASSVQDSTEWSSRHQSIPASEWYFGCFQTKYQKIWDLFAPMFPVTNSASPSSVSVPPQASCHAVMLSLTACTLDFGHSHSAPLTNKTHSKLLSDSDCFWIQSVTTGSQTVT